MDNERNIHAALQQSMGHQKKKKLRLTITTHTPGGEKSKKHAATTDA